jgi:Ser/Thr protein kinase RdoA (MazF antagonist)
MAMKRAVDLPHPRLLEWWTDDPADPDRPSLYDPHVQHLIAAISPQSHATDLGGMMSLNVRLDSSGLVLRVHQPFVSRQRLLAVQEVRRRLAGQGLVVPTPVCWNHTKVFRCKNRWAELEAYLPHERLTPALDAYAWLFRAMGALHGALRDLDLAVPRPLVATYAPPGSLRRWLPVTETAVQGDPDAADLARLLRALVQQLQRQWLPATELPVQLVHGDVRLSNVCRTADGRAVYLDFGFLARRPRIHELAYALAFMLLALDGHRSPDSFAWECIPRLVEDYEATANVRLTPAERRGLAPYTAAVPLYAAALDGFTENPVEKLRSRLPFLHLSAWLLAHPTAFLAFPARRGRSTPRGCSNNSRRSQGRCSRCCDPLVQLP